MFTNINKILLIAITFAFFLTSLLNAKTEQVTVSMGANYAQQTYFQLSTQNSNSVPVDSWDLAFEIQGFAASILINEAKGHKLFFLPDSDAESYSDVINSADIDSWIQMHNSPLKWQQGAFNRDSDGNSVDMGWGEYSMFNHQIRGNVLFVIQTVTNQFKKILIESLASGVYTFKYADLNGENEVVATIDKKDYQGYNFGYYNITSQETVNVEPKSTDWDLVFSRYFDLVPAGPQGLVPYSVTGIRHNKDISVAKVANGAELTQVPNDANFIEEINAIGYNWKSFANMSWVIDKSTAYFVRNYAMQIYKIVFENFEGGTTGNSIFNFTNLNESSVEGNATNLALAVYPNVIEKGNVANLVFEDINLTTAGNLNIEIMDQTGNIVFSNQVNINQGLNQIPLQLNFASGMYFVTTEINGSRAGYKIIVN